MLNLRTENDVHSTVESAQGGDKTALLSLIDHCKGAIMAAVVGVAAPTTVDLDEASHLARLQIFEKFATGYDGTGTPCGWMAVVARNRTRDVIRAESRHTNRSISIDLVDDTLTDVGSTADTTRVETWDLLHRVLAELSDGDAELLKLHYLHGMTRHELADHYGISYEGIRSKLNRACIKAHKILLRAEVQR